MESKWCGGCKSEKEITHFWKNKSTKTGIDNRCKECRKRDRKKWGEENKEYLAQWKHDYHIEHKEEITQGMRERYWENPELGRAKTKEWRENNPEKAKETTQKWREENPDKVRSYALKSHFKHREKRLVRMRAYAHEKSKSIVEKAMIWASENRDKVRENHRRWSSENKDKLIVWNQARRARKRNVASSMSDSQWQWLKEQSNNLCMGCGKQYQRMCRDHIIPLDPGPDTLDNIQPLCNTCNTIKHRKTIDYRPQWMKDAIKKKMKELGLEPQTNLLN